MMYVIICGLDCAETIERCLNSLEMQTFQAWTTEVSMDYAGSNRKYLLLNTIESILRCNPDPEDIIVCLDADDFLCDETALQIINNAYEHDKDLLLTYGSYVNLSTNKPGKFCGAYKDGENFRTSLWRGTHLKTFKFKLYERIPHEELKRGGAYLRCCADRALMLPMLEMAGHERIKFIPTLIYCYNDLNKNSVWKTNRQLSIETRDYLSKRPPLQKVVFG